MGRILSQKVRNAISLVKGGEPVARAAQATGCTPNAIYEFFKRAGTPIGRPEKGARRAISKPRKAAKGHRDTARVQIAVRLSEANFNIVSGLAFKKQVPLSRYIDNAICVYLKAIGELK